MDSARNLYIADGDRIRKVSGGIINTVAGSGGFYGDGALATNALLSSPSGVALDRSGNLYIADAAFQRIRKVSGGTITTVAGNGDIGYSGDGGPAIDAALNYPSHLIVDGAGNLVISDTRNCRIRKVAAGTISTVAGNGTCGFSGDGGPATAASLSYPMGIALDTAGNLYIADALNDRIRKVSGGTITTVAGNGRETFSGDGGPAPSASLIAPGGVALDSGGDIYIADSGNSRIRKVSQGQITTIAGVGNPSGVPVLGDGGPATGAYIAPSNVALDTTGNIYVAEYARVRKITNGIITTIAGTGNFGFSGDGGPATAAQLYNVQDLTLDAAGDLFLADSLNNRIREVLAGKVTYQMSPTALTFSATAGGAATASQTITLSASIPGLAFTSSANVSWLSISPPSGGIPATLQVTADPSTLAAGTYQGTITITVPNAVPATTAIAVSFKVQSPTPPALGVDTQSFSFTGSQGGDAGSQTLLVRNAGGGSLSFTASAAVSSPPGGSWLAISPTGGSATPSSPASLTVTATPGSLTPGTYSGSIAITGAGTTTTIPVTLSVSPPAAAILLSQSAISFTAVSQGGVPLPGTFGILNTGRGSMSWTTTTNTLSGGNWLQISPSSGTVERPYLDVSLVTVSIDPSTLLAGTYYGQIHVSAAAGNTPQVLTVILTVLPAGSTLGPQVFPAGLIFTGVAGATPGSQDVQVGNPSGNATSFLSGVIGTGFDYAPKSAILQANQPTTLRVFPDFSTLQPGNTQQGTITLQFSDLSPPQTISVLTVVAPSGITSNSLAAHAKGLHPEASGCAGQRLYVVFRSPQPSQTTFSALLGQATTLDVQVSDACGNLVGPGGQGSTVTATFSNGDSVPMVHIGNGIWQGTWRPRGAGTVQMAVVAFAVGQNGSLLSGQSAILTAAVTSATTPIVSTVAHAASGLTAPIAPGGLITIYGQNLADSAGPSNGVPLPIQLNGTQVLSGNLPLPIVYAGPNQLNVQVPYGVPVNTQYQLTVQHGNTYSVPQQLVVAQAEPGIFTVNQQGSGQGSIVKSDGITLAQPGTPASIGETVVIYCTGLGSVSPKVAEGVAPPGVPPLSATDNPVSVTIGGQPATVIFSGLTPGDPGLYQINAVVPSGIQTGDSVPVVISVAGQTSPITPPVTMAVR